MNALDCIFTRRSIRRYMQQPIAAADVENILKAAMSAPSAGNGRPWQFVIIDEQEQMEAIPKFHAYSQMLKEAPLAILVCGDERRFKFGGEYWVQDCSAATQNILLACHALGLGAVWLGVYPDQQRIEGLRGLLHLPDYIVPCALVAIGHPAEQKPPNSGYDVSVVHTNCWED